MAAIESGASVVTANKALLAKYGPEIYTAAEAKASTSTSKRPLVAPSRSCCRCANPWRATR